MHEISGGEKQRVVLARALAQQPLVLLLDEPTLHLDIGAQVELLARLRRLAAENRYTVVVVTHELGLAAEFADQIVLLHRGKCLRVGPPAAVYQRELLEQVFEAPLEIETGPAGRPRVLIQGRREYDQAGRRRAARVPAQTSSTRAASRRSAGRAAARSTFTANSAFGKTV